MTPTSHHKRGLRFSPVVKLGPARGLDQPGPLEPFGGVSLRQVRDSIEWARQHREALGGDPKKIGGGR